MDELTKMLLGCFILSCIYYYGIILIDLYQEEYKTKREFIFDLIPFRAWYKGFKERWNNME